MTRPLTIFLSMLTTAAMPAVVAAQVVVQPLGFTDADRLAAMVKRLAINPAELGALIEAGELSLRLDDLSGAASLFARADQIDPRSGRVKAGMARILVRAERPGEALRYFGMAERLGLAPAAFAADRGLAYDLLGEQERAQRDYRLALKAGPTDETVRRYALSLGILGRRDLALEQLAPLLRHADRAAWRARAFVLAMAGDAGEASRIATTMMPPGMATGLQPFFQRLALLPAIDRAFAVHFGEVRATPERLADARLTPVLPALGPDPDAPRVMLAAAAPPSREDRRRARGGRNKRRDAAIEVARRSEAVPAQTIPAPRVAPVQLAAASSAAVPAPIAAATTRLAAVPVAAPPRRAGASAITSPAAGGAVAAQLAQAAPAGRAAAALPAAVPVPVAAENAGAAPAGVPASVPLRRTGGAAMPRVATGRAAAVEPAASAWRVAAPAPAPASMPAPGGRVATASPLVPVAARPLGYAPSPPRASLPAVPVAAAVQPGSGAMATQPGALPGAAGRGPTPAQLANAASPAALAGAIASNAPMPALTAAASAPVPASMLASTRVAAASPWVRTAAPPRASFTAVPMPALIEPGWGAVSTQPGASPVLAARVATPTQLADAALPAAVPGTAIASNAPVPALTATGPAPTTIMSAPFATGDAASSATAGSAGPAPASSVAALPAATAGMSVRDAAASIAVSDAARSVAGPGPVAASLSAISGVAAPWGASGAVNGSSIASVEMPPSAAAIVPTASLAVTPGAVEARGPAAADAGVAVPFSAPGAGEDTILAQIIANLAIPATELGITGPRRGADAASTVRPAAANAVPRPASGGAAGERGSDRTGPRDFGDAARKPGATRTAGDERTNHDRRERDASRSSSKAAGHYRVKFASTDAGQADRASAGAKRGLDKSPSRDEAAADALSTRGKKAAPDEKATAAKADRAKAAQGNPERLWVQVAGGASADDLPKAWAAAKAKAPTAFARRTAYTTPLRATHRVLAGPFKTEAEARSFVNQLARKGVPAFTFTSDKGQPVTKLPSE